MELTERNECYQCIYKRKVPGNAHVACANPDASMTGDSYGIWNGWFFYPFVFDPIWKTKKCTHFKQKENVEGIEK